MGWFDGTVIFGDGRCPFRCDRVTIEDTDFVVRGNRDLPTTSRLDFDEVIRCGMLRDCFDWLVNDLAVFVNRGNPYVTIQFFDQRAEVVFSGVL